MVKDKKTALTVNVGDMIYIVEETNMFPESSLKIKKCKIHSEVILSKEARTKEMTDFTFNGKFNARRNRISDPELNEVIFNENEAKELALERTKESIKKAVEQKSELEAALGLLSTMQEIFESESPIDSNEEGDPIKLEIHVGNGKSTKK